MMSVHVNSKDFQDQASQALSRSQTISCSVSYCLSVWLEAPRIGTQVRPDFVKGKGNLVMAPLFVRRRDVDKGPLSPFISSDSPAAALGGVGVIVPTLQMGGLRLKRGPCNYQDSKLGL